MTSRGEVWRYEDLVAPFDFAIRKTDAEINKEKEALAKDFSPYYEMQLNLVKNQKRAFSEKFDEQLAAVKSSGQFEDLVKYPEKYRNYGSGVLDRLFDAGIIKLRPEHSEKGMILSSILLREIPVISKPLKIFIRLKPL